MTDIKSLRSQSAQSSKLRKLGAQGSLSAARKGENAPRKYAAGGTVGAPISGGSAQPRGRTAGKKGKGKKKGETTVNIALVNHPGAKPGAPGDPGAMPGGPMPLPPGPPLPPGGPGGGPPMPMRAKGGPVTKAEDEAEDKKMMKSAMHKHDAQMHKGQGFTKLRHGGKC